MNPIGSKEQRDELRQPDARDWPTLRDNWDRALDGLDIASRAMRALRVLQILKDGQRIPRIRQYNYWMAAHQALDEALREWKEGGWE